MLITYSDSLGNNLKDLYIRIWKSILGMLLGSSPSTIFSRQQVIVICTG